MTAEQERHQAPRRVDAHHHIWWRDRTPWLSAPAVPRIFGDYEPIRRDYLLSEYAEDARTSAVTASVYVQINVAPQDQVAEVGWVADARGDTQLLRAVVGSADLAAPDLGDLLDRQADLGPVRGVRQQLHWHYNPAYRFASTPQVMLDPAWQRGLTRLAERDLLFETQVFPAQFADMLAAIDTAPDVTFVLLHAGMLEDRSDDGWAQWLSGMREFARRPNIYVKLSGLGTFVRGCEVASWKPVVQQTIDLFGPFRCMFGSNFPIEKLWTTYEHLTTVFDQSIEAYSHPEQQQIRAEVAAALYRI